MEERNEVIAAGGHVSLERVGRDAVGLEIRGGVANAVVTNDRVYVTIPVETWEAVRKFTHPLADYCYKTRVEIEREAEKWAEARISRFKKAATETEKMLIAREGGQIADIRLPKEEQVRGFIAHHLMPRVEEMISKMQG